MTNVLFLCTGNSARSLMAEALLARLGEGRVKAFSAGSRPTGRVHPLTIELLEREGLLIAGLRSKSWDEFLAADAPRMDVVITVCSEAEGETCPVFPGHPKRLHWDIADPAAVAGGLAERRAAFIAAYRELTRRIEDFLSAGLAA
jgi:arsenate reductase